MNIHFSFFLSIFTTIVYVFWKKVLSRVLDTFVLVPWFSIPKAMWYRARYLNCVLVSSSEKWIYLLWSFYLIFYVLKYFNWISYLVTHLSMRRCISKKLIYTETFFRIFLPSHESSCYYLLIPDRKHCDIINIP